MKNETIIKEFQKHGFVILDDIIYNTKTPINIEKDGYKYYICYNAIYKTWNPKKWGINNPYSLSNLSLFLLRNGYTCEIISTKYDYNNIQLRCQCGNTYNVNLSNLLHKRQDTCPHCSAIKGLCVRKSHTQYDDFMKNNNLKIIGRYNGCKKSAYWKSYNTNYIYFGTLYNALHSNKSCDDYFKDSLFDIKNKFAFYNIKNFIKINNLEVKVIQFNGAKQNITLECPKCHKQFTTSFYYFISNKINQCEECNRNHLSKLDIHKFCIDNQLQLKDKYTNQNTPMLLKNQQGYYIYTSIQNYKKYNHNSTIFHLCNPKIINNIKHYIKINNLSCTLLSTKYINAKSKLKFKCKCGQIYYSTLYDLIYNNHICCNNCRKSSHSKLERITSQILTNLNIDFIPQYTYEDCKYKNVLRYDFYLPQYNTCIECQGIQHFESVDYFGGEQNFKIRQLKDKIKFDYCQKNNINIIYIVYSNTQNEIYDILSQINYMKNISGSS